MTASEKLINDCVSPFTKTQRDMLKSLCKLQPRGKDYTAAPNKALEEYIKTLKDLHPEMFQSKDSLQKRVFMDTPMSLIPHARAVRTFEKSPYRIVPVTA